jgi:hypothetical protein
MPAPKKPGPRVAVGPKRGKICVSKKIENHAHAVALHFMYYNFVRIHKTLRTTPAMAANVTKRLWEIGDNGKRREPQHDECALLRR